MSKLRRGSAKDVTKCGILVTCWTGTSQLGSFVNKHEWSVSITFLIQNNITWTNFRRLGGFPAFFTAVTVETSWASELNRPKDFKIKGNDPELSSKTFFPFLLMGLCTRSYDKLNIDLHLGGSCELRDWESKEPICYLTTANKMLKKCFFLSITVLVWDSHIERMHMTTYDSHIGIPKQWNNGHVGEQTNPVGVQLFSYIKIFFCSNKYTWLNTIYIRKGFSSSCSGLHSTCRHVSHAYTHDHFVFGFRFLQCQITATHRLYYLTCKCFQL